MKPYQSLPSTLCESGDDDGTIGFFSVIPRYSVFIFIVVLR